MRLRGVVLVVFTALAAGSVAVALAQEPRDTTGSLFPSPAMKPSPSPSAATPRTLKDSYDAIPLGERISLQADLVWAVNFPGPIDGEYSEQLVNAVRAFQRLNKTKQTGVLNPAEREALSALVKPMQEQVGWQLVYDQSSGARIGLPLKLVPNTSAAKAGSLWRSAQGQVRIESFRIAEANGSLAQFLERQKSEPSERKVEQQTLKPDSFVLIGMQGLKKFQVRAFARNGEVRGLTILYDQAMEVAMDQLIAPMAHSYHPFATPVSLQSIPGPRHKVDYGTGLVVSQVGHLVTDRLVVEACDTIVIPGIGNAERIADDQDNDLALLRVYGADDLVPIPLLGEPPKGSDLMLVGIAEPTAQAGNGVVSTMATRLLNTVSVTGTVTSFSQVPAAGFSGAAALDKSGRFYGMVGLRSTVVAGPAPAAPRATLVPAERIRAFIEANQVTPAGGEAGIEPCKASVVRVICVRR
jgi:hypothetical protein